MCYLLHWKTPRERGYVACVMRNRGNTPISTLLSCFPVVLSSAVLRMLGGAAAWWRSRNDRPRSRTGSGRRSFCRLRGAGWECLSQLCDSWWFDVHATLSFLSVKYTMRYSHMYVDEVIITPFKLVLKITFDDHQTIFGWSVGQFGMVVNHDFYGMRMCGI